MLGYYDDVRHNNTFAAQQGSPDGEGVVTPLDVIERIHQQAVATCKLDDREPPDNGRRGQFKRGWE
jgi:hypothetical protein